MSESTYPRMSEDDYKKLMFQVRGQYIAILNVFRCYGLNPHVDQAIEECIKVAENVGMKVRGKDIPIHVIHGLKDSGI